MSAGFCIDGEVFWGTNGAVEAYVETLAALAADRGGDGHPFSVYLAEQRDCFSSGQVLYLDEWLATREQRVQFLGLLDAATEELFREDVFTEDGRKWVGSVVAAFRRRVVEKTTD